MRAPRTRVGGLLVAAALTVLASGCGAGGFGGSDEPTRLDTSINKYVALGDGFAAAPYVGKTTAKDGCLRSDGNYPTQVAKALSVNEFIDVSCFGATTKSITQSTKAPGGKKLAAQIQAVDRDTDLITLGIGIEDRDMLNTLFKVCLQLPCTDRVAPPDLQKQLDTFEANLTAAVRDLQEKAPSAYIVLVGYPQLMPAQDTCSALPPLTAAELDGAFIVLQNVNNVVRSAAQQTGGIFINVAALSANNDACSDEPWVHDKKTVGGKQKAFHPLAPEQKAVANEIAVRVRAR